MKSDKNLLNETWFFFAENQTNLSLVDANQDVSFEEYDWTINFPVSGATDGKLSAPLSILTNSSDAPFIISLQFHHIINLLNDSTKIDSVNRTRSVGRKVLSYRRPRNVFSVHSLAKKI